MLSIFQLFRRVLVIVVLTYTIVRLIQFVWQWRMFGAGEQKPHRILRQYIEVSFLRFRLRRMWFDIAQILVLVAILWMIVLFQL
jgi:hypothetical protein